MAEDGVTRDIEEALNKFVNTTDQNGNMKMNKIDDLRNSEYTKEFIFDTESKAGGGKN